MSAGDDSARLFPPDSTDGRRAIRSPFPTDFTALAESRRRIRQPQIRPGRATFKGISIKSPAWQQGARRTLDKEPTRENLIGLTDEEVETFYREEQWKPSRAAEVRNDSLRHLYFDFYVNSGPQPATKQLQRAIKQTGGNTEEDGIFGSGAINEHPDPDKLYRQYKQNRENYFYGIDIQRYSDRYGG